jgi:hypothetical protein
MKAPLWIALALLAAAAAFGGCSVGAGDPQKGSATLVATRDFGDRRIVSASEDPIPGGETVMRFLSRKADVDTRYGGRFVNAIDGTRSAIRQGRRFDWLYYVNGIEADKGAAEQEVYAHDRIWWDYRDWSAAMRVPAVVGSYPEPFLHGTEGKRFPVRLECATDAQDECDAVADRLTQAGVDASKAVLGTAAGKNLLRVLVGGWDDVRGDGAARRLEEGPAESGVFARPSAGPGGPVFDVLDQQGRLVRTLGRGAGIVAATRFEDQQPTWIVSGTDAAGLARAVALLEPRTLRDRYAVASSGAGQVPLPVRGEGNP